MRNIPNSIKRAHAPASPSGPEYPLARVMVLAIGTFAVGTDAFVIAGFLPQMAEDLGVTRTAAGLSVTVFAMAYAVLAPVLATATARLPRRTLLVAALGVLALANLGCALAPTLSLLIAARVAAAVGAAAYTPNAGAVAAWMVPAERRGRALAIVIGGLTVATAIGVPLGNQASQWFGWRIALTLIAVLTLIAALGVAVIMPAMPGGNRVRLSARLHALRRPGVMTVLPLTLIGMAACYIPYAYSVPVLRATGASATAMGYLLFLYGLGAVLGNIFSGHATDRWGAVRVLVCAYAAMAAALGALGWLTTGDVSWPAAAGALMLVWGATSWAQTPAQQHRLIAAAPQEAPLVVALNASAIYFGIGLGTLAGGIAIAHGVAMMFVVAATAAICALAFLTITARQAVHRAMGEEASP